METNTQVIEVRIEALKAEIFYTVIKIRTGEVEQELDARPSDALALAVQLNSPIYIHEEVLQRAGLVIPEGKILRTTVFENKEAGSREAVLEQMKAVFAAPPRMPSQTEEECELARKQAMAILTEEFLTEDK